MFINKKNRKKLLIICIAVLLVCFVIGTSYAYWIATITQTEDNYGASKCLDISFVGNFDIDLSGFPPMSDEEGAELPPYVFTIKNTCTMVAKYQVNLDDFDVSPNEALEHQYIKVALDDDIPDILSHFATVDPTIPGAIGSRKLDVGILEPGDEITYELRLWFDEDTPKVSKYFENKIVVIAVPAKEKYCDIADVTKFKNALICDNDGPEVISAKDEPNFAAVADTEALSGMWKSEDDYGDSYYFRGTKADLNNNVIFGGFQWKIIRTTGRGAVKLVYNGTEEQFTNNGTVNNSGVDTVYNIATDYGHGRNANAYVGYMYGTPGGGALYPGGSGATMVPAAYMVEHDNINESIAKELVDQWYENNINNSDEYKIADTIYCGDKGIYSGSGNGVRTASSTSYYPIGRNYTLHEPSLICQNLCRPSSCTGVNYNNTVPLTHDQFTVNQKTYYHKSGVAKEIGNAKLNHPVGLMTVDEVTFAGGVWGVANSTYYLYNGIRYYTMSPVQFLLSVDTYYSYIGYISQTGSLTTAHTATIGNPVYLRPVITIKRNNVVSGGDGSTTNPYIID